MKYTLRAWFLFHFTDFVFLLIEKKNLSPIRPEVSIPATKRMNRIKMRILDKIWSKPKKEKNLSISKLIRSPENTNRCQTSCGYYARIAQIMKNKSLNTFELWMCTLHTVSNIWVVLHSL